MALGVGANLDNTVYFTSIILHFNKEIMQAVDNKVYSVEVFAQKLNHYGVLFHYFHCKQYQIEF